MTLWVMRDEPQKQQAIIRRCAPEACQDNSSPLGRIPAALPHSTTSLPESNRDAVGEVLSHVRITAAWEALGGPPLRHGRGQAFWRGGDGFNVSLDEGKNAWYDHASGEGGGVLDLVQHVCGCGRAGALRWCAELVCISLPDFTVADRARFVRRRGELERAWPAAKSWLRASLCIAEEVLDSLKTALFDATLPQPKLGEIATIEATLSRLRRMDPAAVVNEYRWWLEHHPGLTSAFVRWAEDREAMEWNLLEAYFGSASGKQRHER